MAKVTIGINGFGRIGRTFFRLAAAHDDLEVVAINDLATAPVLGHLLKYDSIHGPYTGSLKTDEDHIIFEGRAIPVLSHSHPNQIPWSDYGVDIVLEATGKFKTKDALAHHRRNGAKKVILAVPPLEDTIKMVVYGINDGSITAEDHIISCASCTTNNAAPMIKVVQDLCGIDQAYITTVHSFTTDQSLHDQPHRDLRRARAAGQSIIPTTTGAAKALTKIFPELAGSMGGCGIRVPVPNGSLSDITFNVQRNTSIAEINHTFQTISENALKNVLCYCNEPIVSIDVNNSCYSCTFDSQMTSVIGKMVKVVGWYDNETGYSARLIDIIKLLIRNHYV
ncbi:MAG: type I glyceraldehyde-3-phosphate dehydrogenase [Bacteroidota bacterium]